MGCTDSKEAARVRDTYAEQLQQPRVVAAMETLRVDRRDAGLRFYRLFAAIDTDQSGAIDMGEFLKHLGLHRTPFAEQVFSNLGRQHAERGMTFDDFMLNIWSFCTMGRQDLLAHVFHIYDDDGNGVLDTVEVEGLLRFIYQTETISPKMAAMLEAADADHDRLITKGKSIAVARRRTRPVHDADVLWLRADEFFALCTANRDLLAPVFELQTRAQEKCFGKAFWANESKKRPAILGSMDDAFAVFNKTLDANAALTTRPLVGGTPPNETTTPGGSGPEPQTDEVTKMTEHPTASERVAQRQQARELQTLLEWVETQRKDPVVDEYLTARSQKTLVDARLEEAKSSPSTPVELLTQLRHRAAVNAKKLDAALVSLQTKWGDEERALIDKRHAAIKSMVKGISAKTLLQQTGKNGAGAAIGDYLQKKLDTAEADVRREFQERWEMLERAASHVDANAQPREDKPPTNAPAVAKKVFVGEDTGANKHTAADYTKVVPIVEEVWAECFDADSQRVYYVSSLGASSWDPPPSFQRQW